MKLKLSLLVASVFSIFFYAQNLSFSDAKFKSLILSSSVNNNIAKDFNGNPISIDANADGEIQLSEAQNVKILNLEIDKNYLYENPATQEGIRYDYYFSHLPNSITDALLFSNVEELYISDTRSAQIVYKDNSRIRKIICLQRWYHIEESFNGNYYENDFYPVDFTVDNCPAIQSMNDISAAYHPYFLGESIFRIKNNPQLKGALVLNNKLVSELYFENQSFTSIDITDCNSLSKLSVPNMNTLQKIEIKNNRDFISYDQEIDLIANNCTSLQEVFCDGDYSDSHAVYITSANLNGCSALKKMKGLNSTNIDFSTAGLNNLEELDCSYYNRYVYTGHQNGFVYWGKVSSLNLSGLPSLKILKAFNQPITENVNFSAATNLESIDITHSCGYMNKVDVSNLAHLHTLKTDRLASFSLPDESDNLKEIIAKNCTSLVNLEFNYNYHLQKLDLENCSSLQSLTLGFNYLYPIFDFEYLNLNQCTSLKELKIYTTKLSNLDLSSCPNLENLILNMPELTTLDTSKNKLLKDVSVEKAPKIFQLDFSANPNLKTIGCVSVPNLSSLNIKNASIEEVVDLFYANSANINICADENQVSQLQQWYPDYTITSDCLLNNQDIKKNALKIYPIPAKDAVFVESEDEVQNITIYDSQGKLLLNQNCTQKRISIDLSKYQQGIYYLNVKTEKAYQIKKIIKN